MAVQNNWEDKGLYRVFSGNISGREVLQANLAIQGDARFDNINYVVNDFLKIDGFDIDDSDISIIASTDNVAAVSNPNIKIAVVATLEPFLVWVRRYMEAMQDAVYPTELFSNLDDAYLWVNSD